MVMRQLSRRADVKKLFKNSEDSPRFWYHVWVGLKLNRYDLDLTEMIRLFGRHIPILALEETMASFRMNFLELG